MTFGLTAGQAGDQPQAIPLLDGVVTRATRAVLGDRAYDGDELLDWLKARDIEAVIPARANRVKARDTDWSIYKMRAQIEAMFGFLKAQFALDMLKGWPGAMRPATDAST